MKASDISIVVEHLTTDHKISGSNPFNNGSTSTEVVTKNKINQNNIKTRFFPSSASGGCCGLYHNHLKIL
jgi:hypothetical protein